MSDLEIRIAREALGLEWSDVESQARRVAEYAAEALERYGFSEEQHKQIERLTAELAVEREAHAQLQARCFDNGQPTHGSVFAERDALRAALEQERHEFKNFHSNLCRRFGYHHDEHDWKRDQVSLEEHIARRAVQPSEQQGKSPGECDCTRCDAATEIERLDRLTGAESWKHCADVCHEREYCCHPDDCTSGKGIDA
jgi:hypothetical protein